MDLRFEVDQAESFRRGVDCPKSIATVWVDPAGIDQATRELIAKRMNGIEVNRLLYDPATQEITQGSGYRIRAMIPTWEGLLEAVKKDEMEVQGKVLNHKMMSAESQSS